MMFKTIEVGKKTKQKTYIMLALCTAVTFLRLFLIAKSKANLAIRSALATVETFNDSIPTKDLP